MCLYFPLVVVHKRIDLLVVLVHLVAMSNPDRDYEVEQSSHKVAVFPLPRCIGIKYAILYASNLIALGRGLVSKQIPTAVFCSNVAPSARAPYPGAL